MPPSSPKFYDPQQVVIYFNGQRLQGFADGEYITVEQLTPSFAEVVGTDGEVARSKSSDARLKIVVKLIQTSASNAALSAIHNTDLSAPNGAGVGTFLMQDLQGGTIATDAKAWIVSYPPGPMDRQAKSREWEFRLPFGRAQLVQGGN